MKTILKWIDNILHPKYCKDCRHSHPYQDRNECYCRMLHVDVNRYARCKDFAGREK